MSSISNDAGVSSSLILFPSYKNLPTPKWYARARSSGERRGEKHDQPTILKVNRQRTVIQTAFVNVPDGPNVFSDLIGIRRLKLRQLRVPLDFKEDFLSGGRQNLQIRHHHEKRREIEGGNVSVHGRIVPPTCRNGGRTLMLIGAVSPVPSCLVTASLGCSVSDIIRKLSVKVVEFKYQRLLPRRRWWLRVKVSDWG